MNDGRWRMANKRREVAEMEFPGYFATAIRENSAMFLEQLRDGTFVIGEVAEGGGIGEPPTCQPTESRLAPMASGSTPIFSQQGDLLSFRHNGDKWQAVHAWLRRARLVVD